VKRFPIKKGKEDGKLTCMRESICKEFHRWIGCQAKIFAPEEEKPYLARSVEVFKRRWNTKRREDYSRRSILAGKKKTRSKQHSDSEITPGNRTRK